jgi:5'-deoxynucleotidase YfbR-like HD superfamily hydrolase
MNQEVELLLDSYIKRLNKINADFNLEINLVDVLLKTINEFASYGDSFILDRWHGLNHGINVLEYALNLSKNDKNIDKESLSVSCLFHDLFGIATKEENFDRNLHNEKGAEYIQNDFKKIIDPSWLLNLNAISVSILSHGDKVKTFLKRFEKRPREEFDIAKYLRDADRLIEGQDINRIISVSESFKKPLITKSISLPERIIFLFMDNKNVLESECTDLLFFLSRNVTINIDKDDYITEEAKNIISNESSEEILNNIISSLGKYKYLGDAENILTGLREALIIFRKVIDLYSKIKEKNKMDIVQNYILETTNNLTRDSYGLKRSKIVLSLQTMLQ